MGAKTTMIALEYILTGVAVLILVSLIANKVLGRLGLPALLIFIFAGMLVTEFPNRLETLPGGLSLPE